MEVLVKQVFVGDDVGVFPADVGIHFSLYRPLPRDLTASAGPMVCRVVPSKKPLGGMWVNSLEGNILECGSPETRAFVTWNRAIEHRRATQ